MANNNKQAKLVTDQPAIRTQQSVENLALFNADGSPFTPGSSAVSAIATKPAIVAVAQVSAPNAVAAVATPPTKAEFDAVVTLANSLKTQLNALIAALKV